MLSPLCSDYECPICFDCMRKPKSVFDFGRIFVEKEKCSRKNSVAHILFEMGEVEKIVKLRILRIQSVESFGNPNLLIVEFRWKLIFLKVGFFPIGIY